MKPQPRWQTWGEQQRSLHVGWRAAFTAVLGVVGSIVIGIVMLVITIAIVFVVLAFFLGAYNQQLYDLVSTPPIPALAGIGMIAFAAWALFRMATGHAAPGSPMWAKIVGVLLLILVAIGGAAILVAALSPDGTTRAF